MRLIIPTLWVLVLGTVCAAVIGVGVWMLIVAHAAVPLVLGVICVLAGLGILAWYLAGTTLVIGDEEAHRLFSRRELQLAEVTAVEAVPGSGSATSAWMVQLRSKDGERVSGGAWLRQPKAEAVAATLRSQLGLAPAARQGEVHVKVKHGLGDDTSINPIVPADPTAWAPPRSESTELPQPESATEQTAVNPIVADQTAINPIVQDSPTQAELAPARARRGLVSEPDEDEGSDRVEDHPRSPRHGSPDSVIEP